MLAGLAVRQPEEDHVVPGEGVERRSARGPGRPAGPGAAGARRAAHRRWSPPVSAPISTPGWPSSSRRTSPPGVPAGSGDRDGDWIMRMTIHCSACMRMRAGPADASRCAGDAPWCTRFRDHDPTRPFPSVYLDHLVTESARFRDVLADCDPRPGPEPVPTGTPPTCSGTSPRCRARGPRCPATGRVSPEEIEGRAPAGDVRRPAGAYDEWSAALVAELERPTRQTRRGLVRRPDRRVHPSAARRTRR